MLPWQKLSKNNLRQQKRYDARGLVANWGCVNSDSKSISALSQKRQQKQEQKSGAESTSAPETAKPEAERQDSLAQMILPSSGPDAQSIAVERERELMEKSSREKVCLVCTARVSSSQDGVPGSTLIVVALPPCLCSIWRKFEPRNNVI